MNQENQYAAFLSDFAAGKLSDGEQLVAQLHFALSDRGAESRRLVDAAGGVILESVPTSINCQTIVEGELEGRAIDGRADAPDWVAHYIKSDLTALKWRRTAFGVRTLPTHLSTASLLRLDPGERAPRHSHGEPDVTLVLQGAFADDWGEYRRGDLAFAAPGERHAPATLGDEVCVCLVATPEGRPSVDLKGVLAGLFKKRKVER